MCKHCTHAGVPRRLPDRRALPHRVRHGRRAAGHLQRLRLLRPRLPVRRASTSATCRARRTTLLALRSRRGGRSRLEVHALLRPAEGRPRARVREGVSDAVDPVRRRRRAARARRTSGSRSSRPSGWNGAQLYGHDPDDGVGGFGAFFLLLDEPEVYGLPPDPVVTTQAPAASCGRTTALAAARDGRRHRGRIRREAAGDRELVLRPADPQGADLDVGDPAVLLHRRDRRRARRCCTARRAVAGNDELARTALYVGAAADARLPAAAHLRTSAGPSGS